MAEKIKVVWLCHFSNSRIREVLPLRSRIIENFFNKVRKLPSFKYSDYAQWITNGIEEFQNYRDVELHVIAPFIGLNPEVYHAEINGIHYHFYRSEDDNVFYKLLLNLHLKKRETSFIKNRKVVSCFINEINPDIVHVYGAENPYYSLSALDIDTEKVPLVVSMQTALNAPGFLDNYPMPLENFEYLKDVEKKVLGKATCLCANSQLFRDVVWNSINPDAIFTRCTLALGEKITSPNTNAAYDFVYFSANISKAADLAIEAFAISVKKHKNLSLLIVGDYSESYKAEIDNRIAELNISSNITFTGQLPTHDDVLRMIKKAKYALIPLKVDTISGTVREAIASSIPVVTTITSGTPSLNEKRESVLLSKIGDANAMALNINTLVEFSDLANKLRNNAIATFRENWSNEVIISELNKMYKLLIKNYRDRRELDPTIFNKNKKYNE